MSTSDESIEQEIQAKGLTAPRVTRELLESKIAAEYYISGSTLFVAASPYVNGPADITDAATAQAMSLLTFCVLVLENGFTVTGESACASPENFDAGLGRKIARGKALDKLWQLEGYLLKERLHTRTPTE